MIKNKPLRPHLVKICCICKRGFGVNNVKFSGFIAACLAGPVLIYLLFATQVVAQGAPAAASAAENTAGNSSTGKSLFEQNCSTCHGIDAGGEEGPDLHGVPGSLGDAAVENIIKRGIRGTAMPGFFELKDQDAADIVAFLHTYDADTTGPVNGDPNSGAALYQDSGCPACHMIRGHGGNIGPELSRIGHMRGPTNLKNRLIDPGANLPQNGTGFYSSKWTMYLMFRAVEKNGNTIEGMRVGENSFVIVLKDINGKLHALWKPDLRSLQKLPGASLMPSFKETLTPAQMDDLVAYLMTLKGQP